MTGRHRALATAVGVIVVAAVVLFAGPLRPGPPAPSGPPTAWVEDALVRVSAHDPPGPRTTAQITAARGETESFQIVTTGGGRPLRGVDLEVSRLGGPGGVFLPAGAVSLFREQFVTVPATLPVAGSAGPGDYADGLVPFTDPATGAPLHGDIPARGVSVDPHRAQPYWVDVAVPRDAVPGVYRGGYTLRTAGGDVSGQVELTVLDLVLPARPALTGAFLNSGGRPAVDAELLRNGAMPGSPVGGLDPALRASGRLNAVNTGFYSGADRDTCAMRPPPTPGEVDAAVREAPAGTSRYNYTADEIADCDDHTTLYPALRDWSRALHRAGVRQLVTMAPDPALFDDGTGAPVVDVWASLPMDHDPALVDAAVGRGMEVWSYTALAQDDYSPKWLIGADPAGLRAMPGFLNQSLGYTGLLYWRVDGWGTVDPWSTAVLYDDRYAGDGMLVYPGDRVGLPGGAAPSLRLKWIRDGIDDYAYAELARRAAGDAAVDRVVRTVAPDWRGWSRDPAALATARAALAELAAGGR
ncbi:DUF4091 domain-containing protein [Pseudonocardia alni]|uniref:Glycoside hydrolase 123 catalytic domain-containing protein n=1 Tax=Pseudonocardia alni TaxID=33907 RepID=A0A852W4W7_PSEA5|nr:DUF4091 domain-containing protein [Pseudonocardia antarctica]NYG04013.1 hypothetical protein [Pseudonocardia antarctica]